VALSPPHCRGGARRPAGVGAAVTAARGALGAALLVACATGLRAQPASSRFWRGDERTLVTDLSRVTAVAATQMVLYAATRDALAVYDRGSGLLREIVTGLDGYPGGPVTAMVADPSDDTAWLGGGGEWAVYQPLGRRFQSGPLPGPADAVVLDRNDASRGAYFHTPAGWYFVPRSGIGAEPTSAVPPPGQWLGGLVPAQLFARAPALDLVRMQIERDDMLRTFPMTSAAMTAASNEAFIGTDGNGVFRVDLDTYTAERLPEGLLATPSAAVAAAGDLVCAGADARARVVRRGITCFPSDLARFSYFEGTTLAGLPGTVTRRLLVTRGALWAASDQGALRIDRRSGDVRRLGTHEGLPSEDARALAPAPEGVWIGTARGLAVAVDTGGAVRTVSALVLDAAVLSLAASGDTLWIGSAAGLYALPPGARVPIPAAPGFPQLAGSPILALASHADTLLAATDTRFAWRAADGWHVVVPPAPSVGRVTALAPDRAGFWVAGTLGLAYYQPGRSVWIALTAPGDVPQPVSDVAAGRDYVWAATPAGVLRLERRVLVP
jgi:ligand-binding sensor domain-containing protein